MELTPRNTATSSIPITFFKFVHSSIRDAFSIVAFFLRPPQTSISNTQNSCKKMENLAGGEQPDKDACSSDETVRMAHLKEVMHRLGIAWEDGDEGEESENIVSRHELTSILVDEEPSLAEVKQCFDVFDENGNGFIEASELQRVLLCLGLKEGRQLEDCNRMIWAFDENGDGRIDLGEFAKLLEKCLG